MKYYITLAILLLASIHIQAQKKPIVRIIARADSTGGIHLRWAATNASAWKRCNQYGFKVARYTVLRNKQLLEKPELKVIGATIIKAKPVDEWKTLAEKNNYAAILAQALYGKSFEVSNASSKGITQIIAQSQELEQRFSFSLYAAEMSFDAAVLAGWGIIDCDTKRDEKYLYRIITAAPAHVLKPDTASVFISPSEYEPLPMIDDVMAQFGNRSVMLNWDCSHLKRVYTSYFVEKSADRGKTFKRLEGAPVSNLNNQDDKSNARMYLMDSLTNNVEYQYRVCGINSFGEEGPYSIPVIGEGREVLSFVPGIESAFLDDSGILQVNWSFEEGGNDLIKGFVLNRSDRSDGKYSVFADTVAATQRKLSLKKPLETTNYFTITAVPKHGESRTSFPALVQAIDSIPPAIPVGLKAVMDTSGVVTLTWNPNTEKDFLGYKVYQALKEGEDLVPLTDSVWFVNKFEDKLNLKLLNRKAWYGISALDKRYNQSDVSALVEVKKPSTIPPSPAVITKYEIKGDSLTLHWVNSMDEDLTTHSLHRKLATDSTFTELIQYPKQQQHTYTDLHLQAGKQYSYYMQAKNEGDLTTSSELLEITVPASAGSAKEITRLYARYQKDQKRIEITWDDQLPEVVEYQIYRGTKGQPLSFWQTTAPMEKGVYDTDIKAGVVYEYAVMATLKSGAYSAMKRVTIKF